MAVKILGGLAEMNFKGKFLDTSPVQLQLQLYEEKNTAGIQIRLGHDSVNGQNIQDLERKIKKLGLPFIVHGPAENLGNDFGEVCDETGKFAEIKKTNPVVSWREFNIDGQRNAQRVATNHCSLDERVIVHPGYSLRTSKSQAESEIKIGKILSTDLKDVKFSLETVPYLASHNGQLEYGFGGTTESMNKLLEIRDNLDILIDFTHVNATANQMKEYSYGFAYPRSFRELVSNYLKFPVSNFTHFSGLIDTSYDQHPGFLDDNHASKRSYEKAVVKDALQELESRSSRDVYVALEINWHKMNLDTAKRQVDSFRRDYV